MANMDSSESSGLDGRVSQTYSVLFIGTGELSLKASQALIAKAKALKDSPAPRVGEIILYGRDENRTYRKVRDLAGEIRHREGDVRICTPRDYGKGAWNTALLRDVLFPRRDDRKAPDVVVFAFRSDKEREGRSQGGLKDRFERAPLNIAELERYAQVFEGYYGTGIVVTNPPDLCTQAFCIAAGLDPKQWAGFTEIDSTSLRQYLFTDGPLFAEKDFTGTPVSPEDLQRFLALRGVGLQRLGIPKIDSYTNIGAFVIGDHGENIVPIISGLAPEQLEMVIHHFEKQRISERAAILERIRADVGGLMRKAYTLTQEPSHDLKGPLAEFIDAPGSIAATRRTLQEQRHNAHARLVPTASVCLEPESQQQRVWFGWPTNIVYDAKRGRVIFLPINPGNNPEEREMVKNALGSYEARVVQLANEHQIDLGIDRPHVERVSPPKQTLPAVPPMLAVGGGNRIAYINSADGTMNEPITVKPIPADGSGIRYIDTHILGAEDERYIALGFSEGIVLLDTGGGTTPLRITTKTKPGRHKRTDASGVIDDILFVSHPEAGISVCDTKGRHAYQWNLLPLERLCALPDAQLRNNSDMRQLQVHAGAAYFVAGNGEKLKQLLVARDDRGKIEIMITDYFVPSAGMRITSYCFDDTGQVYVGTKQGNDAALCMKQPGNRPDEFTRTAIRDAGRIDNLKWMNMNGVPCLIGSAPTRVVCEEARVTLYSEIYLADSQRRVQLPGNAGIRTLDMHKPTHQAFIVGEDSRLYQWNSDSGQLKRIGGDGLSVKCVKVL